MIIDDILIFGEPESETALQQMRNCGVEATHRAMMGDNHQGYSMPIGGVVAYKNHISPSGVGYDIACGNKAVLTDLKFPDVSPHLKDLADSIAKNISFGVGRSNAEKVEHPLFESSAWDNIKAIGISKETANAQLGTVGSGNHYVDVFKDELDRIWVGVHFGSRGLGHKVATYFVKAGGGVDGIMTPPTLLGAKSDLGEQYLEAMNLAGEYAYAGRDWVCQKVADIMGALILEEVHNHHNFAWKEEHSGEEFWVVRKGATPAFPGQKGFVGGTMGENSVILQGKDSQLSKDALYSTVHGAGRVLGRREAIGRFRRDENGKKQREPGKVRHDEMIAWLANKGVELRGGGLDEAPQCYKRLDKVLEHHAETVDVLHILEPLIVVMAGAGEVDPYKD